MAIRTFLLISMIFSTVVFFSEKVIARDSVDTDIKTNVETGFDIWRQGTIVAEAEFDPGIAPFKIEIRKVPVPATKSEHFIVTLFRGDYPVTSFRYFWPMYTPKKVSIEWPCIEHFTVKFDDLYAAHCEWSWGSGAQWSMTTSEGNKPPGLSPYFYTPRNPIAPQCKQYK